MLNLVNNNRLVLNKLLDLFLAKFFPFYDLLFFEVIIWEVFSFYKYTIYKNTQELIFQFLGVNYFIKMSLLQIQPLEPLDKHEIRFLFSF